VRGQRGLSSLHGRPASEKGKATAYPDRGDELGLDVETAVVGQKPERVGSHPPRSGHLCDRAVACDEVEQRAVRTRTHAHRSDG
jgi:hypothetical protein